MDKGMSVAHKALLKLWSSPSKDMAAISQQLSVLKDELDKQTQSTPSSLVVYKDYYEIRTLNAVLKVDLKEFEESISDVLGFYACNFVTSESKYLICGLYLMHLLASHQLSTFHTFIEQIDQNTQSESPYINIPIKLEQFLMEGSYNKVILSDKNAPSPYHSVFFKILTETIRDEIATCVEKAYKKASTKDLYQMLYFDSKSAFNNFLKKRGWRSEKEMVFFNTSEQQEMEVDSPKHYDYSEGIMRNIFYSKRLEMIV